MSTSESVLVEVADALKASAPKVLELVKSRRVDRAVNKRVDLLDKALDKQSQLQNELNSIRLPVKKNFKLVDGQMVETEVVFSQEEVKKYNEDVKQHNKKVKEATEKLEKFNRALEAAFSGEGFEKLEKLVAGGGSDSE